MEHGEFAGSFSTWLRMARERIDLTRKELAYAVGVAPDTIKKYEEGKRRPSSRAARQLARRLGIDDTAAFITFARQPVAGEAHGDQRHALTNYQPGEKVQTQAGDVLLSEGQLATAGWQQWPAVLPDGFRGKQYLWDSGAERDRNGTLVRMTEAGWYRMEVIPSSTAGSGWSSGLFYPVPATFYAAVDVRQPDPKPGNSCGLMFGATNNANYHLFGLRGFSQEYLVTGVRDDENWSAEPDILPTYHKGLRREDVNRIAICGVGHRFTFIINGEVVAVRAIVGLPGIGVDIAVVARRELPAIGLFANFELRTPGKP